MIKFYLQSSINKFKYYLYYSISMINERIIALIREYNPWWDGKEVELPKYKRHMFAEIDKYMETKQILAIVGLRRVGKTILMKQNIQNLKIKSENIFYFLFDELIAQNPDALYDILDYYIKTISGKGKKYIYLDEIQKVPYWQDVLKRFYDTKNDIKFIVSGSASLQIRKSKESLAGRIFDFYLPILTFREFLELNSFKIEKSSLEFTKLKKLYESCLHKKPLLENFFIEYILKGAFPEIANEKDEDIIKNYIKSSVIEKVIFEDIPVVFEVKRKDILSAILEYCSRETSNLLDITSLADMLNVNYQTAKSYLFYLQNSFLIDLLYNYSKSAAKQLRKNKKVHIAHPSITTTIMNYSRKSLLIEEVTGRYVESIIFQHAKILSEKLSFWRTPQKEEVDIIIEGKGKIPIEVKYKNQIKKSETKSLLKFMSKYKIKRGILVTKNIFKKEKIESKEILFIPAWLFLLTV